MIAVNDSYFSPELIVGGHYIISAENDNYVDDYLRKIEIRQLLHTELTEHDFDIVLFCDFHNRMYCYDSKSYRLLRNLNKENEEGNTTKSVYDLIFDEGPMGGLVLEDDYEELNRISAGTDYETYNFAMVDIDVMWHYISELLRQNKYRVGIVFPNVSGLTTFFSPVALEALSEFNSLSTDRPHAVFYIFRSEKGADFSRYAEIGTPEWQSFFNLVLEPLFNASEPSRNRVICLPTANAAEVSNLLNMLRLRDAYPLTVNMTDMRAVAEGIACKCACAEGGISIRALYNSLDEFAKKSPGQALNANNYHSIIGVKEQKTAHEVINSMVGIGNVKKWINEWKDSVGESWSRSFPASSSRFTPLAKNPIKDALILNLVLLSSPGGGKSTIAEQLGRFYYELGILPRGHCVKCTAANLVSPHVGGTARLVRERVMEAMGGVLMIDEAYAIATNAHGREAIDQLVNEMTQYQGQFAVVICGYETKMEAFLKANPGLESRFGTKLKIEDYTPEEMLKIYKLFMERDAERLVMSKELEEIFPVFCDNWVNAGGINWGNAREAANLLGNMKRSAKARRNDSGDRTPDCTIILTVDDIPEELREHLKPKPSDMNEVMEAFDNVIGLDNVKARILEMAKDTSWNTGKKPGAGRYVFYGPPGVGKTYMGRMFCNVLFLMKRIKRNYMYEVEAKQLARPDPRIDYGKANGETPTVSEILEKAFEIARGGVLFIDEAHQLLEDEYNEILTALVPIIDRPDVYKNTCVIIAGYTCEMTAFLRQDKGMRRRFPKINRVRFDNYTADELARLACFFAKDLYGHNVSDDFYTRTRAAFSVYLENPEPDFGNAGFIRDTYVPGAIEAKSTRLSREWLDNGNAIANIHDVNRVGGNRFYLTGDDIPGAFNTMAGPKNFPVRNENVWERVEGLIGKDEIKEYLKSLRKGENEVAFYDSGVRELNHYAIIGPTGSGRHTSARVITAVLKECGILDRNEVKLASKGSFEARFVGNTIPKTMGVIEEAKGGCLVIEYPSAMISDGENLNSYGPQAMGAILGAMKNANEKLSVIFIDTPEGYEELKKHFKDIHSVITEEFKLDDMSPEEMHKLFGNKTQYSYDFSDMYDILPDFFINWISKRGGLCEDTAGWSNGCEIDKLIAEIKNGWEKNKGVINTINGYPMRKITRNMFPEWTSEYLNKASVDKNEAMDKLNNMIGLDGVKEAVEAIARRYRLCGRKMAPGFYAFVGEPGSGKTATAKIMGGVFRSVELLSQGHVIKRTAKQLAENPSEFDACLKLAKNGILFIDEAHQLRETAGGNAVIKKLLTTVEDSKIMENVCIIIAGYEADMKRMLSTDEGFESRFEKDNAVIRFENYTAKELIEIMDFFAKNADTDPYLNFPYKLDVSDDEFRSCSEKIFELVRERRSFGNARFVRNYLDKCINRHLKRIDPGKGHDDEVYEAMLSSITSEDIPVEYMAMINRTVKRASVDAAVVKTHNVENITVEDIKKGTVLLRCFGKDGSNGGATGFIISDNGHILTCAHVARGMEKIQARIYCPGAIGGDYRWMDCDIMEPIFEEADMAMLKLDGKNFNTLSLRGRDEEIAVNEEFFLAGYPLTDILSGGSYDRLECSCVSGTVASIQNDEVVDRVFLACQAMPGNSGSAVVSKADGRVIGVLSGAATDSSKEHKMPVMYPIKYFWDKFSTEEKG